MIFSSVEMKNKLLINTLNAKYKYLMLSISTLKTKNNNLATSNFVKKYRQSQSCILQECN